MADDYPKSSTDVCNLALDLIKQTNITDLGSTTEDNAGPCRRWYDTVRRSLLRRYVWNFAKTDAALSRMSNVTPPEYTDAYAMPGDKLRFLSVGDVFNNTKVTDYDIGSVKDSGAFKTVIFINNSGEANLDIKYIRNVLDVTQFDPLFVELFSHELALKIAHKFTTKPSLIQTLSQEVEDLKPSASSIDGQERPPVQITNSRFANARRLGTRQRSVVTFDFPPGT